MWNYFYCVFCVDWGIQKYPPYKLNLADKGKHCNAKPIMLFKIFYIISQGFCQMSGEGLHFS